MARWRPGDRVKVKGEHGEGVGIVIGRDRRSGTVQVHFDHVAAQKDGQAVEHRSVDGYVPEGNLRRR